MSTIASFTDSRDHAHPVSQSTTISIPAYVYGSVLASIFIVVGLLWDISWHITIGRDGLFSAPHVLIYLGAAFAGLFAGYQCLKTSFWGSLAEKNQMVSFWGIFYSSLGGMFCIWGSIASLTSAPFDDWWHNTYGLDVQIFTPPHTVLLLGLMTVQLGSMFIVMAILNRSRLVESTTERDEKNRTILQWLFMVTAGCLVAMLYLFTSEFIDKFRSHQSIYYQISGVVFPILLFSTGRASGHPWGRTIISVFYMLILLVTNWILQQFPAEPLLGPVLNPVTHFQFFGFPVLLVFPALLCDWLSLRFQHTNDWVLALILAAGFAVSYGVIQWYFSQFLHTSPLARNKIFGSYSWYFGSDPNWEFRYAYSSWIIESAAELTKGLAIAFGLTYLSTRLGLSWGKWMKNVVR